MTNVNGAWKQYSIAMTEPNGGINDIITLKEAKAIFGALRSDDQVVDHREIRNAEQLQRVITARNNSASGVLNYIQNFINKYDPLKRTTDGLSDRQRADAIDLAMNPLYGPDKNLSRKIKLSEVTPALQKALQQAKKELQSVHADLGDSEFKLKGYYEVYASATDKTIVGYAAWGYRTDLGFAPDAVEIHENILGHV